MALTSRELKDFDNIIGPKSSIIASGIARLHLASPDPRKMAARRKDPESILNQFPSLSNSEWTYADVVGGLCLVIDRELQTVVFQIYNIDTSDIRFEYELYEDINYTQLNSRFHCFEMEDCVAGFHFSSEEVAEKFFSKVDALKPRAPSDKKKKKKGGVFSRKSKGRKKKRGKNAVEIGEPIFVQHTGHVGVDGTGDFDFSQITPEWKQIFKQAGIRKRDLKNPETAREIMETIKKQQMTSHYQAQPEYENYTEEDLEQMYTPEVREEYEEYQQQLEEYQNEIEQFRREQQELDRWQRENAHLLDEGGSGGGPIAPPRNTAGSGAPVAPPRNTGVPVAPPRNRQQERAPEAPPRRTREEVEQFQEPELNVGQANQFAEQLQSQQLRSTPRETTPKQVEETNSFAAELKSATTKNYKDAKAQKEALARLEKKHAEAQKPPPTEAPVKMKYDTEKLKKLDEMSAPKLPKTKKKTAQEKLKRNIYEQGVDDEGVPFKPMEEKEAVQKSPEVLQAEQEMEQAQSFAEKARLEAEKLQRERDEIMQRLEMLQQKAKEQKKKIKLPPLPQKPKLPAPPKLPALPKQKLNIPLPPPPPEKPKFALPPPPPEEKTKAPAKKAAEPAKAKKAPPPKPVVAPPPKKPEAKAPVVAPKKKQVIPQQRKASAVPVIKRSEESEKPQAKPPGMGMPSDLMLGIMKGSQSLKAAPAPKPKPKTVKPPPSALLEAISSGRSNLRKTEVKAPPPKSRLSKLPNIRDMGGAKIEGQLMANLAMKIKQRRNHLAGDTDDDSDDDDWSDM